MNILPFPIRRLPLEPVPETIDPTGPGWFYARRETGRWSRGVWTVERAERCPHRHRSAKSAAQCFRRGNPWEPAGAIVHVREDGSHHDVEIHRPKRFMRTAARCGDVEVVAVRWLVRDEIPDPENPIELSFRCGAWESAFWAADTRGSLEVRGMAIALHAAIASVGVEQLVAAWRAMHERVPALHEVDAPA